MPSSRSVIVLNYEELIQQGIAKGNGQPQDLELVQAEWLIDLGRRAAELGAKRRKKHFSAVVTPVNDVEKGLWDGHFTDHYPFITNETVMITPVRNAKKVYVVPFDRTIGATEYTGLLAELDLKPCVDGPAYLLGLMAQISEEGIPEELRDTNIIAAEPDNPSSVFQDKDAVGCFLYVCLADACRELDFAEVKRMNWGDYWAFLAEDA